MKHTHTPKTHKKNPKHQNRGSAHKPTHTGRAHSGHGKDQEILTGFIKTNRQKTGYVDILETDTHVYFPTHNINTALHGDEVTYIITDKIDARRKLPVGKVVSIVERASTRIVGTAVRQGEKWFVSPDDKRIYTDIFIPEPKNMEEHKKVLVSIEWKPKAEYPEGTLLEVIGTAGDNDTEMKSILLEKGFDHQFPPDVEREAAEISKLKRNVAYSEWSFRKDFKNKTTFTIDPADAKDFDDALSIETLPNGHIEVGVHIADVAFFVTPGSALDKEAQKREFSVYLVDRTIPMLPEVLSNDLCSLNPNEEKRAFSALFEIDMEGKVYSREFTRSVIKSNKRFAYEEAQATIDDTSAQYYTELKTLNDIAHKLRKAKALAGAIDFETDEIAFTLDAKGVPLEIHKKQRLDAHKLIEEFMLLANREVAMFIGKEAKGDKSKESLYRIHDVPNKERIEDLTLFLKALGYDLESKDGVVTNKGLQHILKKIEHTPQEALIKTAILRSMAKATYNITNIGHFGLAFDFYTHFTSPIRRYPDLLVHRIIAKKIQGTQITDEDITFFKHIANKASEKEVRAAEAERTSIKYKQVEYMQHHIGESFDATVSGVSEWGLFVEEVHTKSEGLVRLDSLASDFFELDKKTYSIRGKKTGKTYSLGDPIKVKLIRADVENNNLDFTLAEE